MNKDSTKFEISPNFQKVIKPWGYELILTSPTAPLTSKILHLTKGKKFSLHYHEEKEETLVLIKGKAFIYIEDKEGELIKKEMDSRKGYHIRPYQIHRIEAIDETEVLESSTAEKGNSVRIEDDYKRGTETEEDRKTRDSKKVYMD